MKVVSALVLWCITSGLSYATNSTDCSQVDPSKPCHESREESARVVPYAHEDSDESSPRVVAGHLRGSESIFDKDDGAQGNLSGQKRRKREKSGCSRGERVECNAFDNEFGNVFRKKILLCHHQGGDRYKTLCIAERSVRRHLQNHPNDYCGECVDATTTSTTTPPTPPPTPLCFGEDHIPCDNSTDGYYVCVFDNATDYYTTLCSTDASFKDLVMQDGDYCGQCSLSRQFIHSSFVPSIEPINDTEYLASSAGEIFQTEYDAEFNDFGFISLAASLDLIVDVDCTIVGETEGQIVVTFEDDIQADLVERMFPTGSLLAVDGTLFGSCDIVGDANPTPMKSSLDGFILIESVAMFGPATIAVVGESGSVHFLFSQLSVSYSLPDRRNLASIGASFAYEVSFTEPEDYPVALEFKLGLSGRSFVELGKFSWSFFSRTFEISCDFGFLLEAEFSAKLMVQIPGGKYPFADKTFPAKCKDWPKFPIYTLPAAKAIEKVINFFLPGSRAVDLSVGLNIAYPINIQLEAEQEVKLELAGVEAKATTGDKRIRIRTGEAPPVKLVRNDPFGIETKVSTIGDNGTLDDLNIGADLKLKGFAGTKPQLYFSTFGLATGSIGIHSGLFFEAKFSPLGDPYPPVQDYPGLPVSFGVCEKCHLLQMMLEAGIQDPFMTYDILGYFKDDGCGGKDVPMPKFKRTLPVVQGCLLKQSCDAVTLVIQATDDSVLTHWGAPNTAYSFVLLVEDIPGDIGVDEVWFEWTSGLDDDSGDVTAPVSGGRSSTTIKVAYPAPGVYTLNASAYRVDKVGAENNPGEHLATTSVQVKIVETTLAITPPSLEDAAIGADLAFEFTVEGVVPKVSDVKFAWSFGAGLKGMDTSGIMQLLDGSANAMAEFAYDSEGNYTLEVEARAYPSNDVLVNGSVSVNVIGPELAIIPPGLEDAEVGVDYAFYFMARGIPPSVNKVSFSWSFEDEGGANTYEVGPYPVDDAGRANMTMTHNYTAEGHFAINADVRIFSTGEVLAGHSVTVMVFDRAPMLVIEAIDSTVITGGLRNTPYEFNIKAENIPTTVNEVVFEWLPGIGASGSARDVVIDGKAGTTIHLSYDTPGQYTIEAFVFDEQHVELASYAQQIKIEGTVVTIDPPGLTEAEAGEEYTFNFTADEIPPGVSDVKFKWSFGMGTSGTGQSQVSVSNGEAHSNASVTYANDGVYGLTVEVQDASDDETLATRTVLIIVGDVTERDFNLTACDDWEPSKSGGYGTHVDSWGIPADIPPGAAIDFKFDAYYLPDKFLFEYPINNLVLNTGWRGDEDEAGPLYPGGVTSNTDFYREDPGYGEVEDVSVRLMGRDSLQVTVVGPDRDTAWEYSVRCRIVLPNRE